MWRELHITLIYTILQVVFFLKKKKKRACRGWIFFFLFFFSTSFSHSDSRALKHSQSNPSPVSHSLLETFSDQKWILHADLRTCVCCICHSHFPQLNSYRFAEAGTMQTAAMWWEALSDAMCKNLWLWNFFYVLLVSFISLACFTSEGNKYVVGFSYIFSFGEDSHGFFHAFEAQMKKGLSPGRFHGRDWHVFWHRACILNRILGD